MEALLSEWLGGSLEGCSPHKPSYRAGPPLGQALVEGTEEASRHALQGRCSRRVTLQARARGSPPPAGMVGRPAARALAWDTALVSRPGQGPPQCCPEPSAFWQPASLLPGASVVRAVGSALPPAARAAPAVARTGSSVFLKLCREALFHHRADCLCYTCGCGSVPAQCYSDRRETVSRGIFTLPGEIGSEP